MPRPSGFATAWTSSRSYASAFPYHLVGQLVPPLLNGGPDGTDAALRAAGVDADDDTIETWARVLDDVLGTASDDGTELLDLSPAGKQRILVHALGALLRAGSTHGADARSSSTTSTGPIRPAWPSSRSC